MLRVLDREDQDRVRDELAAFFGPRAEIFLEVYDKMRRRKGARRLVAYGWSWSVFVAGYPWFFYRKMYGVGAFLILVPFGINYLAGGAGMVGITGGFALFAKSYYVQSGLRRIAKADELGIEGEDRATYLARAGGVSAAAGAGAAIVFVGLLGFAIAAGIHGAALGHPR